MDLKDAVIDRHSMVGAIALHYVAKQNGAYVKNSVCSWQRSLVISKLLIILIHYLQKMISVSGLRLMIQIAQPYWLR